MPKAVILSGAGRYADPWHPFSKTSALLAGLAQASGWQTVITTDTDQRLADGLDDFDLVSVNTGDPWRHLDDTATNQPDPALISLAQANLAAAFDRGIDVLGMHTAASSLLDYPQFRQALGGEWVLGRSWHPAMSTFEVRPLHDDIAEGLCDFKVFDERYTDLAMDDDIEPLMEAQSSEDEDDVIIAWAHQYGESRVVYDALGHDTRSYDSCGHKSFLKRVLSWLLPQGTFTD